MTRTSLQLIGYDDATAMLSVDRRTLQRLVTADLIPHMRIGRRVLFDVARLRKWVDDQHKRGGSRWRR